MATTHKPKRAKAAGSKKPAAKRSTAKDSRPSNVEVFLGYGGGSTPIVSWVRFNTPALEKSRKAVDKYAAAQKVTFKLALFKLLKRGLEEILTMGKDGVPWKAGETEAQIDLNGGFRKLVEIKYPKDGDEPVPDFKTQVSIALTAGVKAAT
jgi:hypothetical protein